MLWDEPKIFFLERRYFFSIILSEFLKNRVALQVCGGDYLTTIWKKDYRGSFGWDSLDDLHAEIVQRGFRAVGETFSSITASREQPDGSIVNYHLTRTKIYT